jgi:hypothetical protein
MVPLKAGFHRALHGSLRVFGGFMDEVYGVAFDRSRSVSDHTSAENRGGLSKLARTWAFRGFL